MRLSSLFPLLLVPVMTASVAPPTARDAVANDNRRAAGTRVGDTVRVQLVLGRAAWRPDGARGIAVSVEAFGENGRAPSIPAPLLRVRQGTPMAVTVLNTLSDSTIHVYGLWNHPSTGTDSLSVKPGETRTVRFDAGVAGTYLYGARIGANVDDRSDGERETTTGAFIVDPPGTLAPDRVFVINVWSAPGDSTREFRNALAINGLGWPATERLFATNGDTLRWRVINGSGRLHPMHLHGFYFTVLATGDAARGALRPSAEQHEVVTEGMPKFSTISMRWTPHLPGNWLFHCHTGAHVTPEGAALEAASAEHGVAMGLGAGHNAAHDAEAHSDDAMAHMRGLILGIHVAPRPGEKPSPRTATRTLRLDVREAAPRADGSKRFRYALADESDGPWRAGGAPLFVRRGEATDIVVRNHTRESTAVHWHGIELESWSDGVAGWSGTGRTLAPSVAPADSFVARLTLPRAGTFLYHTHLGDFGQMRGGLYGPLIVLPPGESFDPSHDHLILAGNGGGANGVGFLVNGDSMAPEPLVMRAGTAHRFRLMSISLNNSTRFTMTLEGAPATWRIIAKDGADLPVTLRHERPADVFLAVGETTDVVFAPTTPGEYLLSAVNTLPATWSRKVIVTP